MLLLAFLAFAFRFYRLRGQQLQQSVNATDNGIEDEDVNGIEQVPETKEPRQIVEARDGASNEHTEELSEYLGPEKRNR